MKKKIILIGNPVSGRGAPDKINEASEILRSTGHDVQLMLTGKKGDAELFARQISAEFGVRSSEILIIAAGGDGTYNEVINGIAGTDIPMAIMPLGTTNVLAKELGIPEDIDGAIDAALGRGTKTVCLGKITLTQNPAPHPHLGKGGMGGSHSPLVTRYFLLMAGVGFDGIVVYNVNPVIKKYSGKGAYMLSGLNALLKWNPEKLSFSISGKNIEGYSAIICNASKYAGHFKIAPDARINEPSLYAFIMQGRQRFDLVRYVSGIIRGKHLQLKDVAYQKAEKIEINGNAHIQIDGDYFGKAPAKIEIAPDALKLVC